MLGQREKVLGAMLVIPHLKQRPRGRGRVQVQELAAQRLRKAGHSGAARQTPTICCSCRKLLKCLSQKLWHHQERLRVCVAAVDWQPGTIPAPQGLADKQPQP